MDNRKLVQQMDEWGRVWNAALESAASVADTVQAHSKANGLPWRGGQLIADKIRALKTTDIPICPITGMPED